MLGRELLAFAALLGGADAVDRVVVVESAVVVDVEFVLGVR
ncbi:MAG TPA: hypothetical protein VFF40_09865 [Acidimicrobiia bacterium]|nr:hypothetical protein [Acidimicrobiia bacterium]